MGDVITWLLIGAGVLVGVFVLIALVGAFLPRSHDVARSLPTGKCPEAVWQIITDFPSVPSWHKDVTKVERLPDHNGHAVWRETYHGNYPMTLEITEYVEPRRMIRQIADVKGPFSGYWQFDLSPTDAGTVITITEHGEIPNPFFRFMARLFMRPEIYLEAYLKALAGRLGEEPLLKEIPSHEQA